MKKRLAICLTTLLALLSLIGLWPLNVQAAYSFSGGGDGTSGNPYIIKTAADLDHIRDGLTLSYKLQADINLSAFGNWQPIGPGSGNPFKGNFDGAGYTINGLTINSSNSNIGLFGYANGAATFKNVRLENIDITSSSASANIGGLIGFSSSSQITIDHISVTGELKGVGFTAGGLVGQSLSTLTNSESHARLNFRYTNTGGLVGYNSWDSVIKESYASGDVSSNSAIGGLVGNLDGRIENSYATGNVSGTTANHTGGLVGTSFGGTIVNSYAAGIVSSGSGLKGGLVGNEDISPNVTSSYWNVSDNPGLQTVGSASGTDGAVIKNAMKQMATYGGWNPTIWGIQENITYPYLKTFSPTLRVNPLSSLIYSNELANNQFTISGYVRDGSIGEPLVVSYSIKDASNATVAQNVYATNATSGNQTFSFPVTLDGISYTTGTYTINITTNDSVLAHEQLQSLTFNVEDTTAPAEPVITTPSNGQMTNNAMPTISGTAEPGATVSLVLDGAAAGTTTVVANGSWMWTPPSALSEGEHTVTATVTDAAGNESRISKGNTFIVDTTPPVITLIGSNTLQVEAGESFIDPRATAHDLVDGDITGQITVTGSVDTRRLGTYTLTYHVSDQTGNPATAVTRSVDVTDTQAPVITLLGVSFIAFTEGETFVDPGATALDSFEGSLSITVTGIVDNQTPGTYTLRYNVQDSSGNAAVEVTRTVHVNARSSSSDGSSGGDSSSEGGYLYGNADLKQLIVTSKGYELALSPAFAAGTASYRSETAAELVEIRAVPTEVNASVTMKGEALTGAKTVSLDDGDNQFEISVKAENGTIKTYALILHRQAVKEQQPMTPVTPETPLTPAGPPCMFTDIKGHWAMSQICEAAANWIVEGDSPSVFRPDGLVTRVEFATLLMRSLGLSSGTEADELAFVDSKNIPSWATKTISAAVERGILEGYPDGTLRPQQTISRSEMAVMLAKAMKWESNSTQTSFADDAQIPAWARGYIQSVVEHGLLIGREGNLFVPDEHTTRAEAAVAVLRLRGTLQ
ncbi:immunoglobulin-like domain-containing protein [Paenibacillus agricola]|uniref:DUF5011 domain-containing protein n=1 Tax=Paenibacillus agricola TaxID=2716264 RepID=A0ABX0JA85_9BACL|nr:immunoglobulin-like domain-containing protein [Paenibacillus agricola]NHN33062.1 DUF5011 domain-containing protein [Paenibacillus agricola]